MFLDGPGPGNAYFCAYNINNGTNGDSCNPGYEPSSQPYNSGYYTQKGSSCPCTCVNNDAYPTYYKKQHHCDNAGSDDCMEPVK